MSISDHFIFTVFYVYLVGVIAVTIFPIPLDRVLLENLQIIQPPNNWIPFASISQLIATAPLPVMVKQVVGNALLLLPLGFFIPLLKGRFLKAYEIPLTGLIGSLVIEGIQHVIGFMLGYNYRIFDIDDILLNTVGAVLGYILFRLLTPYLNQYKTINRGGKGNTTIT